MTQTIALSPSLCLVLPSGFLPQDKQPAPPTDNPAGSPQPRGPGQPGVAQDPAQKPPGQAAPCMDSTSIWMMVAMFAVFYFLLIRPQQKQEKLRKELISKADRGDRVITSGGMHGVIVSADKDTVTLRVDADVKIKFDRSAVARIVSEESPKDGGKNEPPKDAAKK